MAVSGRKLQDFRDSLSRGSAEDYEHCCDACLTESQQVEAQQYCLNCQEYLCSNCVRYHKKTSATKNHQLLDKDNMDKHSAVPKPAGVCTEKCAIHRDEVIKYFCPKHEGIGCTDCMTINHRTCKLDFIPEKCAGIGESEEYRELLEKLDQKMKEVSAILKKAADKDKEIDGSHDTVIKDIMTFRKEINNHLDTIQKKIEAEASKKKTTSKKAVQAVITSCTNMTSNIKKLLSSLQNSKACNQNGQLFIDIKRAKSELQSRDIQQTDTALLQTSSQFTFNRNKDLETFFAGITSFGKLPEQNIAVDATSKTTPAKTSHAKTTPTKTIQAIASTPRQERTCSYLQHKSDIKFNKLCYITGCSVLSSNKLVLADNDHSTIMVVNTEKNAVVEEKHLDSEPWDIAVLPNDQIAVTMPDKKQIIIMTTAGKLSTDHIIDVKGGCEGIIYNQNCLYVLSWNPYSIHVLDMKGNIKNTISVADQSVFDSPNYMVLSRDHSLLYVSNYSNHSIVSVTLQGKVSAVYTHKDLDGPMGMLVLDDGSLLVCCNNSGTIYHVSADFKQGRQVLDGLRSPWSICYSADRSNVYIGECDEKLPVCWVTYKM